MTTNLYVFPDMGHLSVFVQEKCSTPDPHEQFAIQGLFAPNTAGFAQGAFGVGKKGKLKTVLLGKLLVTLYGVGRYAENFAPLKLGQLRLSIAGLLCAPRSVVFRIEIDTGRGAD